MIKLENIANLVEIPDIIIQWEYKNSKDTNMQFVLSKSMRHAGTDFFQTEVEK